VLHFVGRGGVAAALHPVMLQGEVAAVLHFVWGGCCTPPCDAPPYEGVGWLLCSTLWRGVRGVAATLHQG
jgi:hypothetical protein